MQVQIRCCKLDGIGYEHSWPKLGDLKFNEQLIHEFKVPDNQNAKKRKDEPLNITMLVRTGTNSIEVMQHADSNSYCAVIFLVRS